MNTDRYVDESLNEVLRTLIKNDDHTCYIIKYSETALVLYKVKPSTQTDEWNRKQKNCTKIAGAHPRPQFSVDEQVFMVLEYTETGNVLETIRRFQRQFPNRNVHCCRRSRPNLTILDIYLL